MIFVDSNIPMYLVGAEHPHKVDSRRWLERLVADGERLVSDAEVLQEILHRYVAVARPDAIGPALEVLLSVVDDVFAVEKEDVLAARDVLASIPGLSSRDALHVAIMRRHGVARVLSFDRGFDTVPGISRIG